MTKLRDTLYCHSLDCGRGSMVELELPKLSFAGSSPVTRSRYMQAADGFLPAAFLFRGKCSSGSVVVRFVYVVSNEAGCFAPFFSFRLSRSGAQLQRNVRAVFKRGRYSAILDRGLRREQMQHAARRKPLLRLRHRSLFQRGRNRNFLRRIRASSANRRMQPWELRRSPPLQEIPQDSFLRPRRSLHKP